MHDHSSIRLFIPSLTIGGMIFCCLAADTALGNPSQARRYLERGEYEMARDHFESLAEGSRLASRRAGFRLGQGLAAYGAGDFRGAREGFSGALLSQRRDVRQSAHLGNGNALFQLGWMGLAESAYPSDVGELPDLDRFDAIVRNRIARMLDSDEPETGETDGFARIRDTIVNWSDAVRHYQSAIELAPGGELAVENRRTTLTYLQRLQELLEEEREETEQSMPEPSDGDPEPAPGGEPDDEADDSPESGRGDENEEEDPSSGRDPEQDQEEDRGDGEEPDDREADPGEEPPGEPEDPNETPEERARRILSENADVETGPLNSGRREFFPPEKDW